MKINSKEKEVVKLIFELYLNKGYGTQKIARYLNGEKIQTKKGVKWSQIQICRILDNPIYKGEQITHTVQITDINRKIKAKVDEDEWIRKFKEELRIISDDSFRLVQEERDRRKKMIDNGNRPSNKHLLSNLLYCKNCKTGMRRKKRKAYKRKDGTSKDLGYEWVCTLNDRYGKDRCAYRIAVPEEILINHIKDEIEKLKYDRERRERLFKEHIEINYDKKDILSKIEKLNTEKLNIKKMIRSNLELYSDNAMDTEQYKEQNTQLQKEKKENENELNKLIYFEREIEKAKIKYIDYDKFIQDIDIKKLSNTILKNIIDRIYVFKYPKAIEDLFEYKLQIYINWKFMGANEKELHKEWFDKIYSDTSDSNIDLLSLKPIE